jgi:hypothetical protein
MKFQLDLAVRWLEQKQKSLEAASAEQVVDTDFTRGFNKGIQFSNKHYAESIKELRQLLDGYMVDDVNFDEMESEEHVS